MFTPSVYQQSVFNWSTKGSGNAVISAVAGSGKTTTLIELLKLVSGSAIVLAFNKKIQLEMDFKLKKHNLLAEASTVHALCFSAYRKANSKVKLENRKVRMILENNLSEEDFGLYSGVATKLVALAKDDGAGIFWPISDVSEWQRLMVHHELELEAEANLERAIEISQKTLEVNNLDKDTIDFSDMVYLTILRGYTLPKFDWVLVDECQDLSRLRQAVCKALDHGNTRFLFVGDRGQAIYGFTGADATALDNLISEYKATELPLSVCYRCSTSVIKHAQSWYPTIEAAPDAPTGSVSELEYNLLAENPQSLNLSYKDAILCRTNAPLLRTAFSLIKKGIACRIEGRDIANGLLNVIGKWKVKTLDALENRLSDYLARETQKALTKGNEGLAGVITDKVDCIRACMEKCYLEGKTRVDDLKSLIDSMFSNADDKTTRRDLLTLCSVHKSKGLEWERVFLLGRQDFMPSKWAKKDWMKIQENNLIYVAITRAKRDLVEVTGVSDYLKNK
jgi:DNA helicase-2/ATP-dependent DNA helicase PcrA